MSPSPPYVTAQEIGRVIGAFVGELWARTEAVAILRQLEIEPGPDPIHQVVSLARDIADLIGREPADG
jgi:hypothetical protein